MKVWPSGKDVVGVRRRVASLRLCARTSPRLMSAMHAQRAFAGRFSMAQPGHYRSPRLHINLWASDRSRSPADIACDPSEATKSPLRSYGLVGGPTCRGPWSNVCSRRDRAGAPGPNPPDEFHQSCPKLNPRPFAFRIHSAAVRDLTHPARKRTLAVAALWLVI